MDINNLQTKLFYFLGPPLTPHPEFHVVNATHIEVQWDKPFALPEFDVQYYTLSISFENDTTLNGPYNVSADIAYPIRHYIGNGRNIAKECVYLRFILTATSDAGTSDAGSVIGGFPIGRYNLESFKARVNVLHDYIYQTQIAYLSLVVMEGLSLSFF